MITAIMGYAIGTAQILLLGWVSARTTHARHLRLIRSELRRARGKSRKFGWVKGVPPENDSVPEPPLVSDGFTSTVTSVDFYLTDEFEGDNFQEALFGLLDGLGQLRRYRDGALDRTFEGGLSKDPGQTVKLLDRAYGNAAEYDRKIDLVMFHIDAGLFEIERRLALTRWRQQLKRLGRTLPEGEPPPPVSIGDPRLEAWKALQDPDERDTLLPPTPSKPGSRK